MGYKKGDEVAVKWATKLLLAKLRERDYEVVRLDKILT